MARDYRTVRNNFNRRTERVRKFFPHLPELLQRFPSHIALAYMAQRIEIGDRDTLRAALMINNEVHVDVARDAVDEHMSRSEFRDRFTRCFGGHPRPKSARAPLDEFESVRDRVVHGRTVTNSEVYLGIIHALDYAQAMNEFCAHHLGGFEPFSPDRTSLRGSRDYCSARISRLVAKGLGFFASE